MYLKKLYQKDNMSQYRIISICQRTINIINCAQEGVCLLLVNKGQ